MVGGWVDGSKATEKQGELGRNAGGGDQLPQDVQKKIRHMFFFFSLCITREKHLIHFYIDSDTITLFFLTFIEPFPSAPLKSHLTGLLIQTVFF